MLLGENGRQVRAVLAVERPPTDPRWVGLCAAHGVTLVWPGEFDRLADGPAATGAQQFVIVRCDASRSLRDLIVHMYVLSADSIRQRSDR